MVAMRSVADERGRFKSYHASPLTMSKKRYAVYDDKRRMFLATSKGEARFVYPRSVGYNRRGELIGTYSLSKAKALIRKHKTLNWAYPSLHDIHVNGNHSPMAFRLIRVWSKEWCTLTKSRRAVKKMRRVKKKTRMGDWY